MEYTKAEIRNGSGFPKDAKFMLVGSLNFNGAPVTRVQDTIFIPLPREAWREIEGGCACEYCSENGHSQPAYWDTLAVAAKLVKGRVHDTTWTVHHPAIHGILPKVVRR